MTRVLVTRAAEDAPALAQALVVAGFQPVVVPLATRSWRVLETADVAAANPDADWVLLTSGAVVDVLVAAAPQAWRGARWAAVGAQTARRAIAAGIPVTVTTAGTGVDLAAALGPLDGHRVVLPRGDLADEAKDEQVHQPHRETFEEVRYADAHDAPGHVAVEAHRARLEPEVAHAAPQHPPGQPRAQRMVPLLPEDLPHLLECRVVAHDSSLTLKMSAIASRMLTAD
jgi:uroporphyrinogen-III synthase